MQALSVLSPEKIYIILDRIACLKPIWWCWDVYQLFFIKNRVSNKIYVGFIQGEDSKSHIPWSVLLLFEELIDNIILRSIFSSNNFNKIGSYFVVANCIPFFFFFSLADFSNQAQIMYFKFFFYLFFFLSEICSLSSELPWHEQNSSFVRLSVRPDKGQSASGVLSHFSFVRTVMVRFLVPYQTWRNFCCREAVQDFCFCFFEAILAFS